MNNEHQEQKLAKLRQFFLHLAAYIFVISILFTFSSLLFPAIPWLKIVTVAWTTIIILHAFLTLGYVGFLGKTIEERLLEDH